MEINKNYNYKDFNFVNSKHTKAVDKFQSSVERELEKVCEVLDDVSRQGARDFIKYGKWHLQALSDRFYIVDSLEEPILQISFTEFLNGIVKYYADLFVELAEEDDWHGTSLSDYTDNIKLLEKTLTRLKKIGEKTGITCA